MKKLLALVLALVMSMSLVTISNAAFKDADNIDYKEAVDVMNAVGVFIGDEKGNFNAKENLTREQAAKIIAYLELGDKAADALVGSATFTDVASTRWSAGFIGYCAQAGIVSGNGDGTFSPAGQLTALQFGKMLLVELGYDADTEKLVGTDWAINTSKLMSTAKLMDGIDGSVNQVLTREKAAQMTLNALKAPMVTYENKGSSISINGTVINIGGSSAKYETSTIAKDQNISTVKLTSGEYTVELGEKLYKDLKQSTGVSNDFEQPATKWTLKTEEIGTYEDKADAVYHGKVELGDIYKDLGMSKADSAEYYIDGEKQPNQDVSKGNGTEVGVGNGAVTYVYIDTDTNDVTICTINIWVGSVSKSVAATSSKDAYIVVANESDNTPTSYKNEYETDEEFEDDAIVLYTFSVSAKAIKSVKLAEKVSGELTKIVATKSYALDGTTYKLSAKIGYEAGTTAATMATKSTYNFYLDNDGNVIYVEEEAYVSDDYALVLAIEGEDAGWKVNRVRLLKTDGTTKTYDTDKDYTTKSIAAGDIVTWSYDEKADEVTLKEVNGGAAAAGTYRLGKPETGDATKTTTFKMENSKAAITVATGETIYANSKTVFVVKNGDGDYTVYTGIKNAPGINANSNNVYAAYFCKTNNMATVMFIDASESNVLITDSSSKAIFLAGESKSQLITDKDTKVSYYEYKAVVGGELSTVKVEKDTSFSSAVKVVTGQKDSNNNDKYNYLFAGATYNADGIITSFTTYTDDHGAGVKTDKLSGEYNVALADVSWTVAEDAKIWTIDEDGVISAGTIKSVKKDANDTFIYTAKDGEITNLFVQEVKDGTAPVVTTTYTVETMGCSAASSNVQFVIKNNVTGKWLTADELKALNLAENEIIVVNDGAQKTLEASGTGSYYAKLGGSYAKLQWSFDKSPIAIFDIVAYDGNPAGGATAIYGADAGYVKAHLSSPLSVAGKSLAVYVMRDNFTTSASVVG